MAGGVTPLDLVRTPVTGQVQNFKEYIYIGGHAEASLSQWSQLYGMCL